MSSTDLLVGGQDCYTVLAALRKGLGVRVLRLVLALAVERDRLGTLALGEEEEEVDAVANLGCEFQELEGLRRLEDDDLTTLMLLSLRDEVLKGVRHEIASSVGEEVLTYGIDKSERRSAIELQRMSVVRLDLLGFGDLALKGDIDGKGGVLVASKLGDLDGHRLGLLGRLGLRSLLLSVLLLRSRLGDLGGSGSGSLTLSLGLLRDEVSNSARQMTGRE